MKEVVVFVGIWNLKSKNIKSSWTMNVTKAKFYNHCTRKGEKQILVLILALKNEQPHAKKPVTNAGLNPNLTEFLNDTLRKKGTIILQRQ